MDFTEVMQALSDQLDTITGLRCYAFPPSTIETPAAIVSYPDQITFDETYGRGSDSMKLPVVLAVGKVVDRATRDQLAPFVSGSGSSSVKQVLEAGTYDFTVRVAGCTFDVYQFNAIDYMAAIFEVEIIGS